MSIGFEVEAPENGAAYPTTVLGDMPVVMVRDESGKLRVLHNVCPRDGCIAIWSPKQALSFITGNFHAWTWNLDGSLRNATLFDGKRGEHTILPEHWDADLKEIRCAIWQLQPYLWLAIKTCKPNNKDHRKQALLQWFAFATGPESTDVLPTERGPT